VLREVNVASQTFMKTARQEPRPPMDTQNVQTPDREARKPPATGTKRSGLKPSD
jgi:hypothetical protein